MGADAWRGADFTGPSKQRDNYLTFLITIGDYYSIHKGEKHGQEKSQPGE